ncbi:deoxyribodipyrimidine photo-lyase [Colwellia echini]|uniref:Deoxyribodipyrimidine photo-lyase n=1 Tax=Colwellia echini TaxID=1982103 RepID=A0ABY3MYV9_9GAMM|nr:deoxyribodipyrimidine photo-lyase [Colwellia echini]TYK66207.1 deoxyribodipyrimidine photo-lyase [Colwellia echini]
MLWFRNDLRTHDNPALHYFLNTSCGSSSDSPRKAIFFISEKQWLAHDWSLIKIDFIKRHAAALVDELANLNIELSLVEVDTFDDQVNYLTQYCQAHNVDTVFANSELEFNEHQRDLNCIKQGVPLMLYEADVIVPKGLVLNQSGSMFKVFTPFKNAWLKQVRTAGFDYLGKITRADDKETLADNKVKSVNNIIKSDGLSGTWPLAKEYEANVFSTFLQTKLTGYEQCRDIPSIKGTSGISPYLAAGVISPRYVLIALLNRCPDLLLATDSPEFSWLNELIWREFYRNLMFHEQKLCKHYCFKEQYQLITWHNNQTMFTAWCEGKTGYPLVDAAMRQLNQTGWMHNRLRMVVASFLTKHLLIDWRLGEKYFMQHLIDGDLASNNGGWQWAASTGCDAQPYFRIFNPIRQSERFDPNGEFIRKYLPELSSIPDKQIHFPHKYMEQNNISGYVKPIVDHKEARLKALAFYK